jgi:hypothetical protein
MKTEVSWWRDLQCDGTHNKSFSVILLVSEIVTDIDRRKKPAKRIPKEKLVSFRTIKKKTIKG